MIKIFSGTLQKDLIKTNLKKGFLHSKSKTSFLDQISETSLVVISNTATPGQYKITIDGNDFDPHLKSNRMAFWFRRFIQWFVGKEERNAKIDRVLEAVDNYLLEEMRQRRQQEAQLIQGEMARLTQLIQDKTAFLSKWIQIKDKLQKFDEHVEKNAFGSWNWDQTEKDAAAALESLLYKNPSGQFQDKRNRAEALKSLENKIWHLSDDLNAIKDAKAINGEELEKLDPKGKPPTIVENILKKDNVNPLLAYWAQGPNTSPIFCPKTFWNSIHTQDVFFKNCICSSLKCLSHLFTTDPQEASQLFTKWETNLKNLAALWKASGSENEHIDWIFLDQMKLVTKALLPLNHLLNSISKLPIHVTSLLKKIETLDIPDAMDPLAMSDAEAITLLNRYLVSPATDLSVLFPQSSKMYRWPAECQFTVVLFYLAQQHTLTEIMKDPVEKQERIQTLDTALKVTPHPFVTLLESAASNSLGFSAGLAAAPSFISEPSYTDLLKKSLLRQNSDHWRSIINHAITFSQTPARKQFDDQFNAFQKTFLLDGISALKSKHSHNEVDLPGVVRLNASIDRKDAMRKTKAYLESNDDSALKQEAAKAEGRNLMGMLKMVKVLSPALTNNPILNVLDQSVLPILRQSPPIDPTSEPILNRIQTLLAPLNTLP